MGTSVTFDFLELIVHLPHCFKCPFYYPQSRCCAVSPFYRTYNAIARKWKLKKCPAIRNCIARHSVPASFFTF